MLELLGVGSAICRWYQELHWITWHGDAYFLDDLSTAKFCLAHQSIFIPFSFWCPSNHLYFTVTSNICSLFLMSWRTSNDWICMFRGLISGHIFRAVLQPKAIVISPLVMLYYLTKLARAERMLSTPMSLLLYADWSVKLPGDQLAAVKGPLSFLLATITNATVLRWSFGS